MTDPVGVLQRPKLTVDVSGQAGLLPQFAKSRNGWRLMRLDGSAGQDALVPAVLEATYDQDGAVLTEHDIHRAIWLSNHGSRI